MDKIVEICLNDYFNNGESSEVERKAQDKVIDLVHNLGLSKDAEKQLMDAIGDLVEVAQNELFEAGYNYGNGTRDVVNIDIMM